jgi:hypothetical protein
MFARDHCSGRGEFATKMRHHERDRSSCFRAFVAALFVTTMAVAAVSTNGRRFYDDDPIAREPDPQDASGAAPTDVGLLYELSYNLFVTASYTPSGTRARNINTIDEVPDSSWFTNRVGAVPIAPERVTQGPVVGTPPASEHWVVTREKSGGANPGFTAKDARGETWFLSFDPPSNPEAATGAAVTATKMFWALGYNQVETFLTSFSPANADIDPSATMRRPSGARTPFTRNDLNEVLEKVARNTDGTYRAVAGRALTGKILGGFRYAGTRPDDPNDIVPHQHRRELRALRVFGAWTNLTDLKAGNTLDTVVTENGKRIVKHYLQDVGSTFGMANDEHTYDIGWEYFFERRPTRRRLLSFGFALSPWQTVPYVEYPQIGHFEGDRFDPREWRPQTPTTAYMELRDDDGFWAARRVAAFTDDLIRAAVRAAQFSDPAAEQHLVDVLIKRRNKIASVYLTALNPIVNPVLDANNRLTFENAAVTARVAEPPASYRATWFGFDNATGATRPIGASESGTTTIEAPGALQANPGAYIAIDVMADSAAHPSWREPVRTYFHRRPDGWKLVGLERQPDTLPAGRVAQKSTR